MTSEATWSRPVALTVELDEGGLRGSNGRYERFLADLDGLYRDSRAYQELLAKDNGEPTYWVESSNTEPGPGGLITGISVLQPGKVGDEYYMTKGHLHAMADRAEMYACQAGHGAMLLETIAGDSRVIEMRAGDAVYVPGYWIHRSVNVGSEKFQTLFVYSSDAGQDYGIIERAGGMKQLLVEEDGHWTTRPNPDHGGYSH
jgi:glucose-6-phosphate isomerase